VPYQNYTTKEKPRAIHSNQSTQGHCKKVERKGSLYYGFILMKKEICTSVFCCDIVVIATQLMDEIH